MKKVLCVMVSLSLVACLCACGGSTSSSSSAKEEPAKNEQVEEPEEDVTEPEETEEEPEAKPEEEEIDFNIDWEKLNEDFSADIVSNTDFAKDVYAGLSSSSNDTINITAVVEDSTTPEQVLDFADTLIRQLNLFAHMQDGSIELATKDYYGSLYDKYFVMIGIAPQSEINNREKWFIFDSIAPGVHTRHTIELQKYYR